jgi:hypothetical protein
MPGVTLALAEELVEFDPRKFDVIIRIVYERSIKGLSTLHEYGISSPSSEAASEEQQVMQSREILAAAMASSLGRISNTAAAIDELEQVLYSDVALARSSGATWREVAGALQVTALSAQRRFDPVAKKKHSNYQRDRKARAEGRDSTGDA